MTTHATRWTRHTLTSVIALAVLGCGEADRIAAPSATPQRTISDGKTGGAKGFYFLPPLVAPPQATGTFDATLAPEVSVCELSSTGCGPELARFTPSTSPAVTLDLAGEAYSLLWQTKGGPLAAGRVYRLSVLVGAVALGYADLAVVASPNALKSVPPGFVGLVADHAINVRFRIETGIVASVALTPSSVLLGIGASQAFTLQGFDLHGATVAITDPITWSVSGTEITVTGTGVVGAAGAGLASVTAQVGTLQATAPVEVIHQLLFGFFDPATSSTDLELFAAGAPLAPLATVTDAYASGFTYSPDGARIAYHAGTDDEIVVMNADGTGAARITPTADGRAAFDPSWSPDGAQIVFESIVSPSNFLQYGEIWMMDADGGNAHPILADPGHHLTHPVWSPDGAHIAFVDGWDLRVMDPDGSDAVTLATLPFANDRPSWSPDSRRLAFSGCPSTPAACGLYTVDVATKTLVPLASPTGASTFQAPFWSPDGSRIAFVQRAGFQPYTIDVMLVRPDGSGIVSVWQGALPTAELPMAWRP